MMWAAPTASTPLAAVVGVPGSKSATARALVLSATATGPGTIRGGLVARDTDLMIAGLTALGARIDTTDAHCWRVTPLAGRPRSTAIDCGLAGTVMRFLPPLAATYPTTTAFTGDRAATARPMRPLLIALEQLGVRVDGTALPLVVTGPVTGAAVTFDSSSSSQFVSGLLLAAPGFPAGLTLTHVGPPVPSLPHIAMTVAALAARGVAVTGDVPAWHVEPGPVAPRDETIEPDLTTAAVFLAAALVAGGTVTVPGWPAATTQPGVGFPDIVVQMGAAVSLDAAGLTVRGTGALRGIDLDLHHASELTPVVAALAALADGPTTIRGVAHIQGHETNRLAALSAQITALGGDCRATDDGLVIHPRPLHGGMFATYGDHRMAHAAALLGLRVPGIRLDDVDCTTKTMPGFPARWEQLTR